MEATSLCRRSSVETSVETPLSTIFMNQWLVETVETSTANVRADSMCYGIPGYR
jgi:hypothetical protein